MKIATPKQRDALLATLTVAFVADPFTRWLLPEPDAYLNHYPDFITGFGGTAFDHGTAFYAEDHTATALWSAPSTGSDREAFTAFLISILPEARLMELGAIGEQLREVKPNIDHWHLTFLGTDPDHRGQRIGSDLLDRTLAHGCGQGSPAWLETANPDNLKLYRRHGFEVAGEAQSGTSPVFYGMVRPPA